MSDYLIKDTAKDLNGDLTSEQLNVVYKGKGDFLVSASAGSGKTTVMIRRIVELIKQGKSELSQILAITFTESAAADMKKKLRKRITEVISTLKESAERTRLEKAIKQLPVSNISTIDSFCLNTVKTYFYKLTGISPDFSVCDEGQSAVFLSDAIDKTISDFINSKDEEFIKVRNLYFGRSDSDLIRVITDIKQFLDTETESKREDLISKSKIANSEQKELFDKIIEIYYKLQENFSEIKRDNNVLDFVDIEKFTLEILSNKDVEEEIRNKYKFIFVDEYQDTNGVQEEILNLIKNDNLFMVGDVKQSIYAFRGCRPQFFIDKAKTLKATKMYEELNCNFRSSKKIVQAVNEIFDYGMTEDYYGETYKGNSDLIFQARYPESFEGTVKYVLYEKEKKNKEDNGEVKPVYNILDHLSDEVDDDIKEEALVIANLIEELVKSGKTYYDLSEKKEKPIRYSDITILSRGINSTSEVSENISSLVNELTKRGIPVSCGINENIEYYSEVKMLISCLQLIDNSMQDIPLATVLKSPIGNFTDKELYDISETNNGLSFTDAYELTKERGSEILKNKIKTFEKYLNELREYADYHTCRDVVYKIVKDNDLYSYMYSSKKGDLGVERIKAFLDVLGAGDKNYTVKGFLKYVSANSNALCVPFNSFGDAVKIMSIHKSKGLEFPVVILRGVSSRLNYAEKNSRVYFNRDLGIGLQRFDTVNKIRSQTDFQKEIQAENRKENLKEIMRLIYVALTRAKSHLYLIGEGKFEDNGETFSEIKSIDSLLPLNFQSVEVEKVNVSKLQLKKGERKELKFDAFNINETDEEAINLKNVLNGEYAFNDDVKLPLKTSVTATIGNSKSRIIPEMFEEENGSKTDTEKGIIAHKIMELFDFENKPLLKDFVSEKIAEGILTKEDVDKLDLSKIQNALHNGVFNELKGTKLYREKSFISNIPANELFSDMISCGTPVLVQGVIDLLSVNGEKAHIIDYKYSKKNKEELKKIYSKQLRLYAIALKSAVKVKEVKTTIVNLYTGEVLKIDE